MKSKNISEIVASFNICGMHCRVDHISAGPFSKGGCRVSMLVRGVNPLSCKEA